MARQVNMHEAKTHLSRLVDEAAGGEEIVIARNGKPAARLVQVEQRPKKRPGYGMLRGKLDLPSPEELKRIDAEWLAEYEADQEADDELDLYPDSFREDRP